MSTRYPSRLFLDLPNWVGDTMMALPAVSALLRANSGGDTTINVRPRMQRFVKTIFPTANVVATPPKAHPLTTARRLGLRSRDIGITFRNAYRAKILLYLVARQRFGSQGQGGTFLLTRGASADPDRHQVFDANPLLEMVGLAPLDSRQAVPIPDCLREEGRSLVQSNGLGHHPLIGLAPASAQACAKRWPIEYFAHLAGLLRQRELEPILLIGPGEESMARHILEVTDYKMPVMGADQDVAGLAAMCSQLDAMVAIDSGPMHVASIARTKLIALFGPTDPGRTAPLAANCRVLSSQLDCLPCCQRICPLGHGDCMKNLDPEVVATAVIDVIDHHNHQKRQALN